jgi:hypothetical protein
MSNPPHLPADILTTIAYTSIRAYRSMLSLPRFGRRSLHPKHQLLHLSHFTTHTIRSDEYDGCIIHIWHLSHRSSRKGLTGETDAYFHHRLDGPARLSYMRDNTSPMVKRKKNGTITAECIVSMPPPT